MATIETPGSQDVEPAKQIQRFIWSQGDYAALAAHHADSATRLVSRLPRVTGASLLDVAAGDGNVAIAAAKAGASVTATDLTPRMVELGRERSSNEGLTITWLEADAEALPFDDGTFDIATSAFGAMFAPRPAVVAAELARVVRSGGAVALAAWTPSGFIGRFARAIVARLPTPPVALPEPTDWGVPEIARARLADRCSETITSIHTVTLRHDSVEAGLQFMERTNGPAIAARTLLREDYGDLRAEFSALMSQFNCADDGSLQIDAEYLLIVARVG